MPEETHAATTESGSGHAGGGNPLLRPDPGLGIWTVVTFVLLLVILQKLAWRPILAMLDQREKAIRDSLEEAKRARESAASSVEEQQRILAEARREAQSLIGQSRADAERARADITAKAREEAEKLIASGREAIEQEKRSALSELRRTAADLAIGASERLLRARIDDAKSRELVGAYIQELENVEPRRGPSSTN